jgi:starch-binding outer membrane protein, SusD/RagB family
MKLSRSIYFLLLSLVAGGCTKILDKKDLNSVNESAVWNNIDLATAYVNGIYASNLPGWSTEFADYSDESDGGGNYMYGQLNENSVDYWPYGAIREINVLIDNIDKGTLTDEIKKKLKGEAMFFRAFRYFEMVKRYGGVPLILHPQSVNEDLLVARSPTSVVMQQIITDLDSAIEYLPVIAATSGANDGHVHKGTAMAIKGRVLLYYASPQFDPEQDAAERWQDAYEANKEALEFLSANGFGLYADYSRLWFAEMNKEVIFARRYEYLPANTASFNNWAAATRPLDLSQGATGGNRPTLEMVNAYPMKDGRPIGDPGSAYTYDADYYWKNRDPRFRQTIVYNGAVWGIGIGGPQSGRIQWTYVGGEQNNPTLTGLYMRKSVDTMQSSIQAFNSSTDWIEMRYAEVMLNFAEAANETGHTDEAYTQLTAIRARAGIDPGAGNLYGLDAGMDESAMRDAIIRERQLEMAYEGKRYWDLRRRRLFESTLNGTRRHGHSITLKITKAEWDNLRSSMTPQQLLAELDTKYTDYFTTTVKLLDTQFDINWKPEYYFFAIPTEHLILNSKLEQTNGWAGGTFDPLQ